MTKTVSTWLSIKESCIDLIVDLGKLSTGLPNYIGCVDLVVDFGGLDQFDCRFRKVMPNHCRFRKVVST